MLAQDMLVLSCMRHVDMLDPIYNLQGTSFFAITFPLQGKLGSSIHLLWYASSSVAKSHSGLEMPPYIGQNSVRTYFGREVTG